MSLRRIAALLPLYLQPTYQRTTCTWRCLLSWLVGIILCKWHCIGLSGPQERSNRWSITYLPPGSDDAEARQMVIVSRRVKTWHAHADCQAPCSDSITTKKDSLADQQQVSESTLAGEDTHNVATTMEELVSEIDFVIQGRFVRAAPCIFRSTYSIHSHRGAFEVRVILPGPQPPFYSCCPIERTSQSSVS